MPQKLNISHKGKTYKLEIDSEALIDKKIGEKIPGKDIDASLEGYELEITGTSDKAGFPGFKDFEGPQLRKVLLTYGPGMHNRPKREGKKPTPNTKGLRLRKSVRGNQISQDTVQINIKVIKEGTKKFDDLVKPKAAEGEAQTEATEKPAEKPEAPKEQPKEEAKPTEDTKPEDKKDKGAENTPNEPKAKETPTQ